MIKAETLRALLSALHLRDVGTMQHARRVAQLATGLAQFLGWEGRHLKLIEVAGLLHDIGKIGVPDTVLHKPGALGPDEAALMGLHHNICIDVLQAAGLDSEVIAIVGQAREKFGSASGVYRRPGEPMHMGARILAVADAYDAIRCDWIYRQAKTHEATLEILREHSGTQFDGNIVSALQRWTRESGDPLGVQIEMDLTQATGALSEESIRVHHDISLLQRAFSYLYMLESLYDGFYIVDPDLRITVWNSGIERMLGYTANEMVQKNWTSRVLAYADEKDKPLAESATPMGQVLAALRPVTVTTKIQHVDGRWLNVEAYTVPLIDSRGRIQGVAEIFRDTSRSSRRPLEYHELRMAATRDALTGGSPSCYSTRRIRAKWWAGMAEKSLSFSVRGPISPRRPSGPTGSAWPSASSTLKACTAGRLPRRLASRSPNRATRSTACSGGPMKVCMPRSMADEIALSRGPGPKPMRNAPSLPSPKPTASVTKATSCR